ncbi:hypothetical protein DXG01_009020 [Tephrocybe rancida]|nr:hypothetical protein DXG01_009020 [Tephrocybe rancida]
MLSFLRPLTRRARPISLTTRFSHTRLLSTTPLSPGADTNNAQKPNQNPSPPSAAPEPLIITLIAVEVVIATIRDGPELWEIVIGKDEKETKEHALV